MREEASPNADTSRLRLASAITLCVGGVLLLLWPLFSNETVLEVLLVQATYTAGFALILIGVILGSTRTEGIARVLFIFGAAAALLGVLYSLLLGGFFSVPRWIWAAIPAVIFLGSAIAYGAGRLWVLAAVNALLAGGFLWTAIIGMTPSPWAPPYVDAPTSVAVIVCGIAIGIFPRRSPAS